MIAKQADWEAVAGSFGIQNAPKVNFRTHFLAIHVADTSGQTNSFTISGGDLQVVTHQIRGKCGLWIEGPGGRYLVQSFSRAEVKTVNGVPLSKR